MTSNYWDNIFLKHFIHEPDIIFEVGSRYGDESIVLSNTFPNAKIFSFECNPLTIDICKEKIKNRYNINFFPYALGEKNSKQPFYSYMDNNDGASSLLKRLDYKSTQKNTGYVEIRKLDDFVNQNQISKIDYFCMDVQGYELNVLSGGKNFLKNIQYIVMEEPNPIIDIKHLPKDVYSKYIGAPTPKEIKNFMNSNNFFEIERIMENDIEHNVMYKNIFYR